jgi:hypothetical protein
LTSCASKELLLDGTHNEIDVDEHDDSNDVMISASPLMMY